jgi:hypothetical protein
VVLQRKGWEMRNFNGSVVIPPSIHEMANVCLVLCRRLKVHLLIFKSVACSQPWEKRRNGQCGL